MQHAFTDITFDLSAALQAKGLSTAAASTIMQSAAGHTHTRACECDVGYYGAACSVAGGIPECFNSQLDADESDVDCGGYCQAKCAEGFKCIAAVDCRGGTQCVGGVCLSPDAQNTPVRYALVLPVWLAGVNVGNGDIATSLTDAVKNVLLPHVAGAGGVNTAAAHVLSAYGFNFGGVILRSQLPLFDPSRLHAAEVLYALNVQLGITWQQLEGSFDDSQAAQIGHAAAQSMASLGSAIAMFNAGVTSTPGVLLVGVVADAPNAQVIRLGGAPFGALVAGHITAQVLPPPDMDAVPSRSNPPPDSTAWDDMYQLASVIAASAVGIVLLSLIVLLVYRRRKSQGTGRPQDTSDRRQRSEVMRQAGVFTGVAMVSPLQGGHLPAVSQQRQGQAASLGAALAHHPTLSAASPRGGAGGLYPADWAGKAAWGGLGATPREQRGAQAGLVNW